MNYEKESEVENLEQEYVSASIDQLSDERKARLERGEGKAVCKELKFEGIDRGTIGNISSPTEDSQIAAETVDYFNPSGGVFVNGKKVIWVRIELRSKQATSCIVACENIGEDKYRRIENADILPNCQDPSITRVGGEDILQAVEIEPNKEDNTKINFRAAFYKLKDNFTHFEKFAVSGWGEKDKRLCDQKNGKIGVFDRPVEGEFGRGQVGYFEISGKVEDKLQEAILDPSRRKIVQKFAEGEWGGVNQALLLQNGLMLVIGHIARLAQDKSKDYFTTAALFNPQTQKMSHLRIIFDPSEIKQKISFPGGIDIDEQNDRANLYTGVQDERSFDIVIENPLKSLSKDYGEELHLAA